MGKMSKTKDEIRDKKFHRINDKSLRQLLIHRFINAYGYDKGEVTAQAIVDDILNTIEHYFVVAKPLQLMAEGKAPLDEYYLRYGQLVWMAVPVDEFPERGKSIVCTKMKPVILTYLAAEDIESLRQGFASRQLRINRMVRWCEQAYDQGALLTQLDLAVLLNVCDAVVSDYANEYQRTTGKMLPTRGNIHDLSGAITHKREIITLYLQGHLTPTIARKTRHSKEAVDRYIRDYESVKIVRKATENIDEMSQITHLSKRVIQQYLELIPDDELKSLN
jgi:predicted transcriptional regulator